MSMSPFAKPRTRGQSWPNRLVLPILVLCALITASCATGQRSVYPVAREAGMAGTQRQEFIQLFLRGRWCESQALLAQSVENYLSQDDFCAAARNYIILWKLKQYLGVGDQQLLGRAADLAQTGQSCALPFLVDDHQRATDPEGPGVPFPKLRGAPEASHAPEDLGAPFLTPKDGSYRSLLRDHDFSRLADHLGREKDPLYASVYGRKAALEALHAGQSRLAQDFARAARDLDARQGWIVFLIQDWKIQWELSTDQAQREQILRRIQRLEQIIQPCPI
jgi:hypothetical protein